MNKSEDTGYMMIQTQPEGTVTSVFDPRIDMTLHDFMSMVRQFAIASGYLESQVSEYIGE